MDLKLPAFTPVVESQIIHEIAMPLIATDRGGANVIVSGTAVLIAPGLAITAYHVIEDFLRRYEPQVKLEDVGEAPFQLLAYLTLGGTSRLPLRVMRITRAMSSDLAVLELAIPADWPNSFEWRCPALDLMPPRVGSYIHAFGFPNVTVLSQPTADEPAEIRMEGFTTTGEVIEVHAERRDAVRMPFPCFRVNARFDGGMSGGPVFDGSTGLLCGVICSSLPATTADEESASYVSSLWPLAGTVLNAGAGQAYLFAELFRNGTISAAHLDRVSAFLTDKGQSSVSVQLEPVS